jgi:DNA sulfur modification protein DndB
MVEMEKTTISNRSIKLFTLNGIYEATGSLLNKHKGCTVSKNEGKLAYQFWVALGKAMPEWQLAVERKVSAAELRQQFVHAHTVVLHAIGIAGQALLEQRPKDWQTRLQKLKRLDWRRTNHEWEGKAMLDGQMSKARQNVRLTATYLMEHLGINVNKTSVRVMNDESESRGT